MVYICVRDSIVIKYVSPWGRNHFSVLGMTGSYAVFPSLHQSCSIPFFCTCPAFSYAVLISRSQITVRVPSSSQCIPFVLDATGFFDLSAVQTRSSDADCSTHVEMCRARDEQRRVRDRPCTTGLGYVEAQATSILRPLFSRLYI